MKQKIYMVRFLMVMVTLLFVFVIIIIPLDPTGRDKDDSIVTKILENAGLKVDEDQLATVIIGGDVMLGRSVMAKSIDENNFKYSFTHIAAVLRSADLTFVNMENAIIENCPKVYSETLIFCASPDMLQGVRYAGIDVVTLANNHSSNYGKAGLDQTKAYLTGSNIAHVGFGNLVIKEAKGTKFGFLGFEYIDSGPSEEDLRLIKDSNKQVDVLIAGIHWGVEYTSEPTELQREWAQQLVAAGVDVIAGHHPHWVQSVEYIDNKPVFYSLGNLVFDQMWSEKTRKGLLMKLTFKQSDIYQQEKINIYMQEWAQPIIVK